MGKVKHKEKGINWNKIGKGLWHGMKALDSAGKKEADWFFGVDLKRSYEPDREMMGGWDREAEDFFNMRKKPKDKKEIIIVRA